MKKLIVLFVSIISFNALFAQSAYDRNGRQYRADDGYAKNQTDRRQPAYNNEHGYQNNDRRFDGKERQAQIDRVNREYDQRINGYRNDRRMNAHDRDRKIYEAQRERQQRVYSFDKGVAVGALAGIILGAVLSH